MLFIIKCSSVGLRLEFSDFSEFYSVLLQLIDCGVDSSFEFYSSEKGYTGFALA